MTSPYLSDDCFYCILKYFQEDRLTLYNCINVNRFWCRATIPLLYANPFNARNNIIMTLISCFNKKEIIQLKNQLEAIGINNIINIDEGYKPLFEYPKYLKYYNFTKVNLRMNDWIMSHSNLSYHLSYQNVKDFGSIFHQSILNHSINIENFSIDFSAIFRFYFTFKIPTISFEKLNSLTIDLRYLTHDDEKEFLSNVADHCLNLNELKISSQMIPNISYTSTDETFSMEKVYTIIQNQRNIKKLYISQYKVDDNIFLSLESLKFSLISIEFTNTEFSNISFDHFSNLHSLKYLNFMSCKDVEPFDRYESLKFASFELKELRLVENYWNKNVEPIIIKHLGTSLQHLTIFDNNMTIPLIENISTHCLSLVTLQMNISKSFKDLDLSIFPYFKNPMMSKLIIDNTGTHDYDISKMLIKLAMNLSINVKDITFSTHLDSYYSKQHFKMFLENCHGDLEKIELNDLLMGPEYFEIVLNYFETSNKNLKLLTIFRTEELDDEEVKLMNEIMSKGVNVVINYSNTF
ncbi:hypothetical protein RclHR1_08040006 [Rhizophagus clarus]|uniref:F-box domain-containing protein n=1 Tax=Rhizophagus clarus TaxID=94130 RepID=A0A2Z6RZK5_9GLOM|nr:hypothetical protein RclHR1_08040006 [Rhizophagus clarus]GES83321.1 hypothetical protein GLOIN_2v1774869 [Rhizophagus clarus]